MKLVRGACPSCRNDKAVLVPHNGHLVWDLHDITTWGGARMPCRAGGQHLCDLPARDVWHLTGLLTPVCPHDKP